MVCEKKNIGKTMRSLMLLFQELYLRFLYLIRDKNRKSAYFCSFKGQYSDSPRAISEAIHEIDPSIHLVWRLKEDVEAPDYVERVSGKHDSKKAQVQADAWVLTSPAPSKGNYKGKGTYYVETWHGDRCFKRIAWAAEETMGGQYRGHEELPDMSDVNLYTAASEYGVMQAHEGLRYFGEIQLAGLPRNDKLVNISKYDEYSSRIRQKLGVSNDVKILLYAPTFRDNLKQLQSTNVDLHKTIQILEHNGEKWICLVRAHSGSKGLNVKVDDKLIDVTKYGDMADLLLVADCLITDYSGCAGDFVLTGRPCVLAHFDRAEYENSSRTLWFNPDESGFLIAKNQQELDTIMLNLYSYNHEAIDKKVLDFYKTTETGESGIITAKRIIEWINKHHI